MNKIIQKNETLPIPARILLVDDDSVLREEFKDCFEEYGVTEASNGEQALQMLKRPNEIDLVILDVKMYGMNGIEVLSIIKETYPTLKIVMLTGNSSKDVAIDALKARADDYIEKPFDIDDMRELIEKTLEEKVIKAASGPDYMKTKLERIKSFVERNCFKKVGLNDAAKVVSMSPKYLSRIFKEETGEGFNEYRLKIKTAKAKDMLTKTSYNIDQIADKLGYKNTESFTRIFKKITGYNPSEYRNKKKK